MERRRAAWAGVAAAGFALGMTELCAGLVAPVPSLVSAVGSVIVDVVPPAVEDLAIALFGTADKAALGVGTVVVALLLGALVGVDARRAPRRAWWWFGAAAAFGVWSAALQPHTSVGGALVGGAVGVIAGVAMLRTLLRRAAPQPTDALPADGGRRRFLAAVLGAGAAALAAGAVGRALLLRTAEVVRRALPHPRRTVPPPGPDHVLTVPGISPLITPNEDFYRVDTALVVPRIDPERWRLRITGMVERPLELTLDDLYDGDLEERYVTLACVSNEVGGDLIGTARWTGVPLRPLLERAGVRAGAGQVVGRSVDGWTCGFPTELVFDGREPLIAVGMNGEPLPARHGYPARLIVPGLYGYVSATKWLTEIELTTWDGFDAYWVPRGWAKEAPIKMSSRIDVPREGARLPAGTPVTVAGVAWVPLRGISAVEVQVDDLDWVRAEVATPLSDATWVQWRAEVVLPDPGSHLLRVRAVDGEGTVQTERVAPPRPDGATGLHTIRVAAG